MKKPHVTHVSFGCASVYSLFIAVNLVQYLLGLAELEITRTFKCRYAVLRVVHGSWVEQWYKRNGYVQWHDSPFGYPTDGFIELRKEL